MKFGKPDQLAPVDLFLPSDDQGTPDVLKSHKTSAHPSLYVGCAKWNRKDLKNFYPRGTKDELAYYSTQFNSIEVNATFYRIFPASVFAGWKDKTPEHFLFFPKLPQIISHHKRLKDARHYVDEFLGSASNLGEKLGTIFLQMPENFGPKNADSIKRLSHFISDWPRAFSLAVELRHTEWFNNPTVANELYALFEEHAITNVITDTAGRRDLLHMRLTTPKAFIRYVGANHKSDYTRLDDWVERLAEWGEQGIQEMAFFVHQHDEVESPLLARHFIERLNVRMQRDLQVPRTSKPHQEALFS